MFTQGNNKTYDGTNAATVTLIGNPASGGNITLNAGTATFDTMDAGINKTITLGNTSLGGTDANKFVLFTASGTTVASITPASLFVTAASATKPYGETITLTGFTVAGLVNDETIGTITETSPGTTATASVADSPYAITPGVASGGSFKPSDYSIVYIDGTLTVIPHPKIP